jgi:hypothetical protein
MWLLVAKLVPKCFSHLLLLLLWHVFFIILYYHYDPLVLFNFIHFFFRQKRVRSLLKVGLCISKNNQIVQDFKMAKDMNQSSSLTYI